MDTDSSFLFSHLQPGATTELGIHPKWIKISRIFFHRGSTGFGFKSPGSFIFKLCCFRENCLTGKFCHRKESRKSIKTTHLCWLNLTKPLDRNLIIRYQWKGKTKLLKLFVQPFTLLHTFFDTCVWTVAIFSWEFLFLYLQNLLPGHIFKSALRGS